MGEGNNSAAKMNESVSRENENIKHPTELPLLNNKEKNADKEKQIDDSHLPSVKHPTSYIETLINLIKGNSGAGMFAMGDAYKNAGLLAAPILTMCLGVICVYGNHILVNACKTIRVRKKLDHLPTFSETVEYCFEEGPDTIRSFATTARKMTFLFITITQLGFCSVYFLFISSTFNKVLTPHGIVIDVHIYMAIILIPILLTALIGTLKYLTPFSFIANVCLMSGVVLTLYLSAQDLPPLSSRNAVANLSQLPLFFGTTIYSFEGIALVLPLQNEMRKPKNFDRPLGVLNVGMSVICGILCWIGFIGYLKYGDEVKGSLTLNLPQNERFSEIVQLVISVGILLSYTLQFYVAAQIIWALVKNKFGPFKRQKLAEKICRTCIVLFTFTLAESVPNIGLFISLVGAVCGTTLALIFPPICDLVLRWPSDFGKFKWRLVLNFFCLLVAAIGLTTGSFYSIKEIVNIYWK